MGKETLEDYKKRGLTEGDYYMDMHFKEEEEQKQKDLETFFKNKKERAMAIERYEKMIHDKVKVEVYTNEEARAILDEFKEDKFKESVTEFLFYKSKLEDMLSDDLDPRKERELTNAIINGTLPGIVVEPMTSFQSNVESFTKEKESETIMATEEKNMKTEQVVEQPLEQEKKEEQKAEEVKEEKKDAPKVKIKDKEEQKNEYKFDAEEEKKKEEARKSRVDRANLEREMLRERMETAAFTETGVPRGIDARSGKIKVYQNELNFHYAALNTITNVDWSNAIPYGDGIAIFITDDIFVVYNELTTGYQAFDIIDCLMPDAGAQEFFDEYHLRYTREHIIDKFHDPYRSICFTKNEIEYLEETFSQLKLFARRVAVYSYRSGGNLLAMEDSDYRKVISYFRENNIVHVNTYDNTEFQTEEERERKAFELGYKKANEDRPLFKNGEKVYVNKKMKKVAAKAVGIFATSALLQGVGKRFIGKGIGGTILGVVMCAAGSALNLIGFQIGNKVTSKLNDEVIFG